MRQNSTLKNFISSLLQPIKQLIFPSQCLCCKAFHKKSSLVCDDCLHWMEVRPWVGHEKVLITFEKFSPAKELMVYFKKGTFPSLASIFASYMTIQYTQTSLPFPDLITAVPTSMYRKLHMGYEPAKQIALEMAELLNVPFVNGFKRLSQLYRQDLLTDDKRYELSSKEFAWSFSGSLRGKRVLLIDDTVTTGATFSCCAAHLWKEGPSKIFKMACLDRGFLKE